MQINNTRMVGAMLLSPLLLPHTLFYLFSPKKQLIRSDVGGGGEYLSTV